MRTIYLILLVVTVKFCAVFAIDTDNSLPLFVPDSLIFPFLDEFISHEKSCSYYSDDLVFFISVESIKGTDTTFSLSHNKSFDTQLKIYKKENHIGALVYMDHLFIIEGNVFLDVIFKKFGKERISVYEVYDDEKDKVISEFDDTASNRSYIYKKGMILPHPFFNHANCDCRD